MSTEVDGTRSYMDIHEVVNNPTLDMIHYMIYKITPSNIHDFNIRKIPVAIGEIINCIIVLFSLMLYLSATEPRNTFYLSTFRERYR